MATNGDQPRQPEPIDRRRLFLNLGLSLLFIVLCLFLPAGTWAWTRGWLFLLVLVVASILGHLVSATGQSRGHRRSDQPPRGDETLGSALGGDLLLPTMLAIPIVAALDDGRYHWSHVPWWVCVLGYALLIAGMVG